MKPDLSKMPPVHFTVRVASARVSEIARILRDAACEQSFRSVSEAIALYGEECAVVENDPLKTFKVRARGFLIISPKQVVTYCPDTIEGFEATMPNGNQFCLGLARFPSSIEVDGKRFKTIPEWFAQSMTFAHTVKLDQENRMQCIESHRSVLRILRIAEDLGCEVVVQDPYGQWKHSAGQGAIGKAIDSAKRLAACGH